MSRFPLTRTSSQAAMLARCHFDHGSRTAESTDECTDESPGAERRDTPLLDPRRLQLNIRGMLPRWLSGT